MTEIANVNLLQDEKNVIMSLIIYYLYEDCVLQYFNFDPDKSLNHASTYHIVMVNQLY